MSKFIGVKMIEANLMFANVAAEFGYKIGVHNLNKMGYEVTYPDGYKSWCPTDEFEKAYFPLDSDGNKILETDVERFIAAKNINTIGTKTAVVSIKTITGYEYHGLSSCVSPKEYNQEIGEYYVTNKAKDEILNNLGFVLQWAKNGLKYNKTNKE